MCEEYISGEIDLILNSFFLFLILGLLGLLLLFVFELFLWFVILVSFGFHVLVEFCVSVV